MSTREEMEHWRLRLLELVALLKTTQGMNQRQVAEQIGITPDYLSRLLYIEGKKGRKNLGIDTMRKACTAFGLPTDWFDLPTGEPPASAVVHETATPQVQQSTPTNIARPKVLSWPFQTVTYQRVMELKRTLGPKLGHDAIRDIDKMIEIVVLKWEKEASDRKRHAG